jgi:hypothetical protein
MHFVHITVIGVGAIESKRMSSSECKEYENEQKKAESLTAFSREHQDVLERLHSKCDRRELIEST